jgi:hypothetical protein
MPTIDVHPDLHPDVQPLAMLLGTWSGGGHGEYPTIEPFDYRETVTFEHVGKPFLVYRQRTSRVSDGFPLHAEMGYWRSPGPGRVELVIAHPFGATEIDEGIVEGGRIDVCSTSIATTSTAKELTSVERTFQLDDDVLHYTVRIAAVGVPLTHHLEATLRRTA